MSSQSRRGGGSWKRNADEADMTPEESKKKQKNREAAKKHREKKEKTLRELEEKNKQLETQKADLMKDKVSLEQLILNTETLIQQHKMAGCCLPQELEEELVNFRVNSHSEGLISPSNSNNGSDSPGSSTSPDAMDQSGAHGHGISSTSASPPIRLTFVGGERPAVSQDPAVALFSGTPLQSGAAATAAKPQAPPRQPEASSPMRQKNLNINVQQDSQHLQALTKQRGQLSSVQALSGHNYLTEQVSPEIYLVSSSRKQQQQQNPQITEAIDATVDAPSIASCQTSSLMLQSPAQSLEKIAASDDDKLTLIKWPNGKIYVVKQTQALTNSVVTQETQNPGTSQVYQTGRDVHGCGTSGTTGNIPTAELLNNFELTNNISISTEEQTNEMAYAVNAAGHSLWDRETYDFLGDTSRQLPTPIPDNYSYTDDLNQSENAQMILGQMQGQTFQPSHRANNLCVQVMDQMQTLSGPSAQPEDLASLPQPIANQTASGTQVTTASSMVFAPAILNMLNDSQITPTLQNQIKADLMSNPVYALSKSAASSHSPSQHQPGNHPDPTPQTDVTRSQMVLAGSNSGTRLVFQNQGQVLGTIVSDRDCALSETDLVTSYTYTPHSTHLSRQPFNGQ